MSTDIDHLMEEPRPEPVADVPEAKLATAVLHVEDDMGYRTDVQMLYSGSLLAIRRAVRELNPGHIPIYSDYDCTGKLCFQSCKLLKVYRQYAGGFVAVVEIRKTFDV